MALNKVRPPSPPVVLLEPYVLSDLPPIGNDYYDPNDYLDSGHHEVDRTDELEYEEVELYKDSHQEKLGLTVCYRTDDENDTGIYVGEINPNGIAAKDGRIRTGDRIIQINGVEVQNREEAVAILTREDSTNVSLLLARPEMELDEGWMEERNEAMDIPGREEGEEPPAGLVKANPAQQVSDEDEKGSANTRNILSNSQDLDSGVGRTDESTRNDESSEHDILGDDQTSTTTTTTTTSSTTNTTPGSLRRFRHDKGEGLPARARACDFHLSTDSLAAPELLPGLTEEECDRYRELLEIKCHLENGNGLCYQRGRELDVNRNEGVGHVVGMLQEELRHLEFKCRNVLRAQKMQQLRERCMKAWLAGEGGPFDATGAGAGAEPQRHGLCDITELPERSDKDSTSAYNTGESCRSTPLLAEPAPDSPSQPGSERRSNANNLNLNLGRAPLLPCQASPAKFRSLPREGEGRRHPEEKGKRGLKGAGGEGSPYLSRCHRGSPSRQGRLSERYRSCVQLVQPQAGSDCGQSLAGSKAEPRMEWKVKVRSDGSRYVAKRPVRDKLLKARAMKIREERSGVTTDDDAVSEMKMGRYWSKEERKQHLVRAREQRKRREFMIQSRLDCLKEQQSAEARSELSIIALSHKKTMRKRNKKILDNWMTIQEMLAHGTRTVDGKRVYNPLLSVTTV
ncbi:PDZ domain-containing protein 4-like isoform X2 [Heptranchias perlo]|uniref:PDZ domain-containing protein 4-like isoform X2 n=1 Tax=Heptranchias perlo TaxID=212740 RepID=UPI0035596766